MKDQLISSVEKLKDMEKNQRATEAELVAVKGEMKNLESRFTNVAEEYDMAIGTINERDEELAALGEALVGEQALTRSLQQQLTDLKVKYGEVYFRDTLLAKSPQWGVCAHLLQRPNTNIPHLKLLQETIGKKHKKNKKGSKPDVELLLSLGVCVTGACVSSHYLIDTPIPTTPSFIPLRLAQRIVLECLSWWDGDRPATEYPPLRFADVLSIVTSVDPVGMGMHQSRRRRYAVDLVERTSLIVGHISHHVRGLLKSPPHRDCWDATTKCLDALPLVTMDSSLLNTGSSKKDSLSVRATKDKPLSCCGGVLLASFATASGALELSGPADESTLYHPDLQRTIDDATKTSSPLHSWSSMLSPPKSSSLRAGLYNTLQLVGPHRTVEDSLLALCYEVAISQQIPGVAARSLLGTLDTLFSVFSAQDVANGGGTHRNMIPVSVAHAITDLTCNRVAYCYHTHHQKWIRQNSLEKGKRFKSATKGNHDISLFPAGAAIYDEDTHSFQVVDEYAFYYPATYLHWKPLAEDDASLGKLAMSVEFNTPLIPYAELFRPRRDVDGNGLRPFVNTILGHSIERCVEFYREVSEALLLIFPTSFTGQKVDVARDLSTTLGVTAPQPAIQSVPVLDVAHALKDVMVKYLAQTVLDAELFSRSRFPTVPTGQCPIANLKLDAASEVVGTVVAVKLIAFMTTSYESVGSTKIPCSVDNAMSTVRQLSCSQEDVQRFIATTSLVGHVGPNLLEECLGSLGVCDLSESSISQFELFLRRMFTSSGELPMVSISAIVNLDDFVQHGDAAATGISSHNQADALGISCSPLSIVEGMGM